MSEIEMFRQSGVGRVGVVITLPECPENKIKRSGQWQATSDGHQTCGNGMPLDAAPHEINESAD